MPRDPSTGEEAVVLAIGQGGPNVQLVRRPRRGRTLWKVGMD